MVHAGRHLCLWRVAVRNLPNRCPVWADAALAEEVLEKEVALVAAFAYRCNSIVNSFEAGDAGATLADVLRFVVVVAIVLIAKTSLACGGPFSPVLEASVGYSSLLWFVVAFRVPPPPPPPGLLGRIHRWLSGPRKIIIVL